MPLTCPSLFHNLGGVLFGAAPKATNPQFHHRRLHDHQRSLSAAQLEEAKQKQRLNSIWGFKCSKQQVSLS